MDTGNRICVNTPCIPSLIMNLRFLYLWVLSHRALVPSEQISTHSLIWFLFLWRENYFEIIFKTVYFRTSSIYLCLLSESHAICTKIILFLAFTNFSIHKYTYTLYILTYIYIYIFPLFYRFTCFHSFQHSSPINSCALWPILNYFDNNNHLLFSNAVIIIF